MEQLERLGARCVHVVRTTFRPGQPEFLMAVLPIVSYWVVAGFYEALDRCPAPSIVRYRVTRAKPGRANTVTRRQVFVRVLLQQLLQTVLGYVFIVADPGHCGRVQPKGPLGSALQVLLGMFVMDTWQYWIHRWVHVNQWLYKHFHSTHHRLYITYAMGALYNHPLEALLLDTVGAGLSMAAAGMTCQLAACFFAFSTVKTVFDHCSYRLPLNPIHDLFPNSAAYHDVHHDVRGIKKNFSQPFFTWWDKVCGTYLDPAQFHLTQEEIDARLGLTPAIAPVKERSGAPAPGEAVLQAAAPMPQRAEHEALGHPGVEGGSPVGSAEADSSSRRRGGAGRNRAATGARKGHATVASVEDSSEVTAAGGEVSASRSVGGRSRRRRSGSGGDKAVAEPGVTTRSRARHQQQ